MTKNCPKSCKTCDVHLTGVDGNHAGSRKIDKAYNIELIGKTYPYGLGSTSSAQYYTTRDE